MPHYTLAEYVAAKVKYYYMVHVTITTNTNTHRYTHTHTHTHTHRGFLGLGHLITTFQNKKLGINLKQQQQKRYFH